MVEDWRTLFVLFQVQAEKIPHPIILKWVLFWDDFEMLVKRWKKASFTEYNEEMFWLEPITITITKNSRSLTLVK